VPKDRRCDISKRMTATATGVGAGRCTVCERRGGRNRAFNPRLAAYARADAAFSAPAKYGKEDTMVADRSRRLLPEPDDMDDGGFSFEQICELLGFDPGSLRRGLQRWLDVQHCSRVVPRT